MPVSLSSSRTVRSALTTMLVVAATACSGDQPITANVAPTVPAANPQTTSATLRGTVREDGTVIFESLDPSIHAGDGNSNAAIYGNQNVTAMVTVSGFNLTDNGTTKTWTFKLAVHNLLNFPIGSIDGAAAPYDTVGMYVFFPTAPSVISPANCGCAVSIQNTQGSASFTAPNQQYYWYRDRLAAKGQAGDSTRNVPTWKFTAPSRVTSFRFFVVLSSPWPRGMQTQDTTWSTFYNPGVDSLPDANAKPRWKRIGVAYGGTDNASSSGLTMNVNDQSGNFNDMFFFRSDNLNRLEQAYAETRLSLPTSRGTAPVAVLALADSVKFVALGIGNGRVGFVTFNGNTFQWRWIGLPLTQSTTGSHAYRIGKFGATNATIYVDGVAKLSAANSALPDNFMPMYAAFVGEQAAHLSTFFGATAQGGSAKAVVSYITYAFHATPAP